MKALFRKIHRWLGLLMAVQILAWMVSGLYFAWFPIETIRGEHLVAEAPPPDPARFDAAVSPAQAWSGLRSSLGPGVKFTSMSLAERDGVPAYRITGNHNGQAFVRLVNALTGTPLPAVDAAQAERIAAAALRVPATLEGVDIIEDTPAGAEWRGRALPLWRVRYGEPERLSVYVDNWTGDVVARRTTRWRIFDFLWMLHIMDFDERDDFNTPLLQVAALLGLILALTGLVYWAMTTRLFRGARRA